MGESPSGYIVRAAMSTMPMLRRLWAEHRLASACSHTQTLVLSYDDGPTRPTTERVLDLLAAESTPATFFLLGARAMREQSLVDRMKAAGHEIGCHSYCHHNAWRTTAAEGVSDVEAGYAALSRWVAHDGIFRPPYGKVTNATSRAIHDRGASFGWWTIEAGDTEDVLPEPRDVVEAVSARGGGVVLMHDGHPKDALDDGRIEFVLETTRRLIEMARGRGLNIKRLSEVG